MNHPEAKVIKTAFGSFLKEKSLTAAAKALKQKGIRLTTATLGGGFRPRLGHFTVGNLHTILRNKTYVGIKIYHVNGIEKEAKAVWEPIVDLTAFYRVGEILKKNYGRKKPDSPQRYPFLLSGIISCSGCGENLCGRSAHGNGGKIPSYDHSWSTRRQGCLIKKTFPCRPNRVLAKKLEPAVWEKVEKLLTEPTTGKLLLEEATRLYEKRTGKKAILPIKEKIRALKKQLE